MADVTLETLAAQLAGLARKVDHITSDIAGMKGDIAGMKGDIAGMKGDFAGVKGEIAALAGKLDEATGGGKVTLAFLARQQGQILQEQQQARATSRVTETLLGRLDVSIQGLTAEVRALREQQQLQTDQWRDHEARLGRLEEHAPA